MKKIKVGFAICGSFCTFSHIIPQIELLANKGYDIIPIMSETAYQTDTRFGNAKDIIAEIESICIKKIIHSQKGVEPLGPQDMTDIMVIAPCTGNTLSKLSNAITDSTVTLAAKSHLRGKKPLLIALATNDALGGSAVNIGKLLNTKNIYFVPLSQDDPKNKPNSLVANFTLLEPAIAAALQGKQIEPLFC